MIFRMPLLLVFCLVLSLPGCYSVPRQGELFTAAVIRPVTMEDLLPDRREMLANAVLQGVTVEEVRQHRLLVISCATAKGAQSELMPYLALAPPELADLLAWDYIEAERGVRIGEQGPLTRILRRDRIPGGGGLTTVLGRPEVLCREDPETGVFHARVDYFITPFAMLRAEWQSRDPLRGLDEAEIRAGRIVRLSCTPAEETNGLTWYARIPEGFAAGKDLSAAGSTQIVEVRAGRPEVDWHGGIAGPMSRLTRSIEDKAAREHWPIELSTVIRRLPAPPGGYSRLGAPYCGRGVNP